MYNGDETGFRIDPQAGKVLAPKGEISYTESGGIKEQITVLVTSRADGMLMTSAIVYPYKRAIPKCIADQIPDGFCVGKSDSGWMDSSIFFEYMANTFLQELAVIRRQDKRLAGKDELILNDSDWVIYFIDGYILILSILLNRVKLIKCCTALRHMHHTFVNQMTLDHSNLSKVNGKLQLLTADSAIRSSLNKSGLCLHFR